MRTHKFRHYFASEQLAAGVSVEDVRKMLGTSPRNSQNIRALDQGRGGAVGRSAVRSLETARFGRKRKFKGENSISRSARDAHSGECVLQAFLNERNRKVSNINSYPVEVKFLSSMNRRATAAKRV